MWITHYCVHFHQHIIYMRMVCVERKKNPSNIRIVLQGKRRRNSEGDHVNGIISWSVLNANEFTGILVYWICEARVLFNTRGEKLMLWARVTPSQNCWLLMLIEFQSACVSCLVFLLSIYPKFVYRCQRSSHSIYSLRFSVSVYLDMCIAHCENCIEEAKNV